MSKIKMFASVSMDGYVSRIDGGINWTLRYLEKQKHGFEDFIGTVDSVVFNLKHSRCSRLMTSTGNTGICRAM